MNRRRMAVAGLVGSVLVMTGTVGAMAQAAPATPTPWSPQAIPPGITVEPLANTPPLPYGPPTTTAGLQRITYAPGAALDLHYHGPVLYAVVQGALTVEVGDRHVVIEAVGQAGGHALGGAGVAHGIAVLTPHHAVYAEDGYFGPTRNAGDEPLVVIAVLIVPQRPGETTFGTDAATPVP